MAHNHEIVGANPTTTTESKTMCTSEQNTNVKATCLIERCDRTVRIRGLCMKHYIQAYRRVLLGETTWRELKAAGLVAQRRPKMKAWNVGLMTSEPCIVDDCNRLSRARGLCLNHYRTARIEVAAGRTTWDDLVAAGQASALKQPSRPHTEDECRRIGESQVGKEMTPETRTKMRKSAVHANELRHQRWLKYHDKMVAKYGPNYREYPVVFNSKLRRTIRERDGHKCQGCGCPQVECRRLLDVHHIDGDKNNNDPVNLIALCQTCHVGTKRNEAHWISYFQKLMVELELKRELAHRGMNQ